MADKPTDQALIDADRLEGSKDQAGQAEKPKEHAKPGPDQATLDKGKTKPEKLPAGFPPGMPDELKPGEDKG